MNEIYVELHFIKANLFVILIVRITSFPYNLYIRTNNYIKKI